jgi:5-methylcytosine-specific restriction protein B
MSVSPPPGFAWKNFNSFTAFDGLIQSLFTDRKSWLLRTDEPIDLETALKEIRERFIDGFDEGKDSFDQKAKLQFADASRNAKIVFSHAEYLWAMHSVIITKDTKRSFALRWFSDADVRDDEDAYFDGRVHSIANPGPYYQTNKYNEVRAILRIFSLVSERPAGTPVDEIKSRIEAEAYRAMHGNPKPVNGFSVNQYCGIHAALLHLCNPEEYESIISKNHRESILGVFSHMIAESDDASCPEERIKLIRDRLYHDYEHEDPEWKYRWFFYIPSVKPLWIGKDKGQQIFASIQRQIQEEENAIPLEDDEGEPLEARGMRLQRSAALVREVKERDKKTCRACGFYFKGEIVHAHHLDPLAERERRKSTPNDFVTLCPNCHYLAHYYLRQNNGEIFKQCTQLLNKLQETPVKSPNL